MKTCFQKEITFKTRLLANFKNITEFLTVFETQLQKVLNDSWKLQHYTFDNGDDIITCISLITPEGLIIKNKFQLFSYCDLRNICRRKISCVCYKILSNKHTNKIYLVLNETLTPMTRALKLIKSRKILRKKLQNIL